MHPHTHKYLWFCARKRTECTRQPRVWRNLCQVVVDLQALPETSKPRVSSGKQRRQSLLHMMKHQLQAAG